MQQNISIPAVCKKCGELFDLAYDIKVGMEDIERLSLKKNVSLCWECRYS